MPGWIQNATLSSRSVSEPIRGHCSEYVLTNKPVWQYADRRSPKYLGFSPSEVRTAFQFVREDHTKPAAIRAALRLMARGVVRLTIRPDFTFVGRVERMLWSEARDDDGAFVSATMELLLLGKEIRDDF